MPKRRQLCQMIQGIFIRKGRLVEQWAGGKEFFKLLRPYVSVRFMEQVKSVILPALYLALFQILILRQLVQNSRVIMSGVFAVIVE